MAEPIPGWYTEEEVGWLRACRLCPRECGADRFAGGEGICGTDAGIHISSICIHRGEEPAISGKHGICNIFFTGCNLQCGFCQNYQISNPRASAEHPALSLDVVMESVLRILDRGIHGVGFVSPSHVYPQVMAILRALEKTGKNPVTVWNTNAYEHPENIARLEGKVSVYLPDLKYVTPEMAAKYSGARDYPEVACAVVEEMYRQKGSTLQTDEAGQAVSGLIIRHLVLPGHADESIRVLEYIATHLSPRVAISLMSQYYPPGFPTGRPAPKRTLYREEYARVVDAFHSIGFGKGWVQDLESTGYYRPDFDRSHPFETGS